MDDLDDFCQVSCTPTDARYRAVDGGAYHSVALTHDGRIVTWGRDDFGQVHFSPHGDSFVAISANGNHSIALYDGTTCLSDLNGDGIVNGADLGLLLGAWGPCR